MYGKEYIEWKENQKDDYIDSIELYLSIYEGKDNDKLGYTYDFVCGVAYGLLIAKQEYESKLRNSERNIQREALRQSDSFRTVPAPESRKGFGIGGWAT